MNAELEPLTQLHPARRRRAARRSSTSPAPIVRRAERAAVALARGEPLNPLALAYFNRLSDHLFVLRAGCWRRQRAATCCGNPAQPG